MLIYPNLLCILHIYFSHGGVNWKLLGKFNFSLFRSTYSIDIDCNNLVHDKKYNAMEQTSAGETNSCQVIK
jgi:hypothetical protein